MYHWNSYYAPKGRASGQRVEEWSLSTSKSQRTKNYALLLHNRGPAITSHRFELRKAYLHNMTSVSCAVPLGQERSSSCVWSPPPLPNPPP